METEKVTHTAVLVCQALLSNIKTVQYVVDFCTRLTVFIVDSKDNISMVNGILWNRGNSIEYCLTAGLTISQLDEKSKYHIQY